MKYLLLALVLTGCVSSTTYEADKAQLYSRIDSTSVSLKETQRLTCLLLGQQCIVAGVLTLATVPESAKAMSPDQIHELCTTQAIQCLKSFNLEVE